VYGVFKEYFLIRIGSLAGLPNVTEVAVQGAFLYVVYRNLPSLKDSPGNVLMWD
jgi:hypothetical protein